MKVVLSFLSILIIHATFLSSCGFNAVYKTDYMMGELDAIEVSPISSIEGAELYRYLSDLLPLKRTPLYILKISFTYTESPIAIQKNSDVIRENVNHLVHYELQNIHTGEIATKGKFKQMTSYNSTFYPYASYIEKEHAIKNLTKHSSEEIRRRLILYFKSRNK